MAHNHRSMHTASLIGLCSLLKSLARVSNHIKGLFNQKRGYCSHIQAIYLAFATILAAFEIVLSTSEMDVIYWPSELYQRFMQAFEAILSAFAIVF